MRPSDCRHLSAQVAFSPRGAASEDSSAASFARPGLHALAVFDGCGGAGAWRYPELGGVTGALAASRCAADVFSAWAAELPENAAEDPQAMARGLEAAVNEALLRLKADCAEPGVAGSMVRAFPSTAACAVVTEGPGESLLLTALNVGDSRICVLTPERGLTQVTRDDSRGSPDPLEALRRRPPLSAMMSASAPWSFTVSQLALPLPCAVIAATDGAYGWARSPMDFECALLGALSAAEDPAAFEEAMRTALAAVPDDDATLLLSLYGWDDLAALRRDLAPRLGELSAMAEALDALAFPAEQEAAIDRLWAEYRRTALPGPDEA